MSVAGPHPQPWMSVADPFPYPWMSVAGPFPQPWMSVAGPYPHPWMSVAGVKAQLSQALNGSGNLGLVSPLAFTARDLMISVLRGGGGVHVPDCPGCSDYPTPCNPPSDCNINSKIWDDPAQYVVFPADLGTVRSMLEQAALPLRTQAGAAGLAGPAGSGLAFTARDLMIPVFPAGAGLPPGGGFGTFDPCVGGTGAPCGGSFPPVCPLDSGIAVACQHGTGFDLHTTIPQCTCTPGPEDPRQVNINPAELSVLQAALQGVLQNQGLFGGGYR
jgi:hypothetical protein